MDYQTNQCNGSLTKVTSEDLTELCVTLYDILSILLCSASSKYTLNYKGTL